MSVMSSQRRQLTKKVKGTKRDRVLTDAARKGRAFKGTPEFMVQRARKAIRMQRRGLESLNRGLRAMGLPEMVLRAKG